MYNIYKQPSNTMHGTMDLKYICICKIRTYIRMYLTQHYDIGSILLYSWIFYSLTGIYYYFWVNSKDKKSAALK
jgi:hypothetical protein